MTSAAPAARSAAEPPSPTQLPLNLHQRLVEIAREVKVQATGTTGRAAGNQRAISIGDVDEALGPLFVKHGVISDFEFAEEPKSFKVPTKDGEMTMWQVGITAHLSNVDVPQDSLGRKLFDIGSNPSAAVSFALKRWYRALFKLVEDDDSQEGRAAYSGPRPGGQKDDTVPQTLQDLAFNLPKAWFPKKLTAKVASLGPDKVLVELIEEHKTQCGENCPHVPVGAFDKEEAVG